ncbi:hypothetical protein [Paenibacillus swuensis]|uniref:hypothetical protein n=1 Tax=Paenibacillus swuensis TaxID=1178515 RepID=UPI0012FBCD32|nr:hypothetical protein [Paenibacillus swuensis]
MLKDIKSPDEGGWSAISVPRDFISSDVGGLSEISVPGNIISSDVGGWSEISVLGDFISLDVGGWVEISVPGNIISSDVGGWSAFTIYCIPKLNKVRSQPQGSKGTQGQDRLSQLQRADRRAADFGVGFFYLYFNSNELFSETIKLNTGRPGTEFFGSTLK